MIEQYLKGHNARVDVQDYVLKEGFFIESRKQNICSADIDWLLFALYIAWILFGWLNLRAVSYE